MFCPICRSFITLSVRKCSVCGSVVNAGSKPKGKKRSRNVKVNNSSTKRKSKKKKKKAKKKFKTEPRNKVLGGFEGGKTRLYNDRRRFEFEVLGFY